ncbi:YbfB/YjiJ family MFS transporter [Alcaligenaceae bacterium CGII-47]|nr:YbfB/YjiJ family MFS transporter [Alcaligenaceae bacterium CGII-47]
MRAAWAPWALAGGSAVAVGFARFGYALILPAMQTDMHLSYAQAGWLNTANSIGYLLGAVLTIYFVARLGNRALFISGIILTTLALLACGLTQDFQLLALYRFLSGLGGAGTFICGGVLAGVLSMRAIVIFFSGGGIGMLLTGVTLPWLFESAGPIAWPVAWLAIGAVCVPLSIVSIWASRGITEPSSLQILAIWDWRRSLAALSAYFLFGLGYIAYMTFIVAWLKSSHASTIKLATATSVMWTILGVATLAAPTLWRRIFNGRRDGQPMGLALATVALGAAIPLFIPNIGGAWASALLMGASVFMVPSAVTSFIKANLAKPAWGHAMAVATTLFALGQAIGPVAAGWISDLSGSLSTGLAVSAAILMIGALIAFVQKPIP